MLLDSRISLLSRGCFRPKLSVEDVLSGHGVLLDVYSSNDKLSGGDVEFSESALLFLDKPIVVPNMGYLYSTRLRSTKDLLIERVVSDLMFLNPNIDDYGITKMTSWLVSYFVGLDKDGNKCLRYEDLLPIVSMFCNKYSGGDVDIVENSKIILYKRESLLTGADKRWYSNHYRSKLISVLKGELIHQAAIMASEKIYHNLKINKPCVLRYTEDVDTLATLNKYIENRTLRFLEDENGNRYFKSQDSVDKFIKFVSIYDSDKTLNDYVNELNISKSTAIQFRKLKNEQLKK